MTPEEQLKEVRTILHSKMNSEKKVRRIHQATAPQQVAPAGFGGATFGSANFGG